VAKGLLAPMPSKDLSVLKRTMMMSSLGQCHGCDTIEMEVSFAASVDGKFQMNWKKGFAVDKCVVIQWSS
jgi:hypothetical protein